MRRLLFVTIIGSLVAIAVVGLGVYYYERPTVLRVAVTRDSDDQSILAAAALAFGEDRASIRLKLIAVDSFADASRTLEEGHADLAVVRSDIAMPLSGQTVLIMRRNAAVLFAPAQSPLRSIGDLHGHKVGILEAVPAGKVDNQALLDTALAQYDVPLASVQRVSLTLAELPHAIEHKEIDAVFAVGVPGSERLTEAVNTFAAPGHGQPVFIPIAEAKAIAQRSPFFEGIEVVRGAFGGAQPKPAVEFDTLGVSTRLVARHGLSNETVGAMIRLMVAARPAIVARIPIANRIETPPADKGAALPVHPGALAYLDDEEQSFFEKYSDVFYIGAMCLSVLGTGLAAIATRLTHHRSPDADKILRRLIDITKAVRSAERLELLDGYEEEADELLALGLAPDAIHALSVNRMGALNLALNQLRHAIAGRRQSLAVSARPHFAPRVVRE